MMTDRHFSRLVSSTLEDSPVEGEEKEREREREKGRERRKEREGEREKGEREREIGEGRGGKERRDSETSHEIDETTLVEHEIHRITKSCLCNAQRQIFYKPWSSSSFMLESGGVKLSPIRSRLPMLS